MKKILFPHLSLMLFTLVWASCSKEKISPQKNEPGSVVSVEKSPFGNPFTQNSGAIEGAIEPAGTKALLTIYNDTFETSEYPADLTTGKFKINNIPEGIYWLMIKYVQTNSDTWNFFYVPGIKVTSNHVTYSGNFILP